MWLLTLFLLCVFVSAIASVAFVSLILPWAQLYLSLELKEKVPRWVWIAFAAQGLMLGYTYFWVANVL